MTERKVDFSKKFVMPEKAGVQDSSRRNAKHWIPVFTGMTDEV